MNAPERSTSYVLEPGEPKISHAVDTRIRNAANFQINKEDHTIGNLLKADLLKNKRVLFAAYQSKGANRWDKGTIERVGCNL